MNDDRMLESVSQFEGLEVVVTEKMDGEGTTFYRDDLHARSLSFEPHPSREHIKAIWAQVGYQIPEGYRVCGENLTAKHSIFYTNLPGYFLVFNIWNEKNICLSWDDTVLYSELLGLPTVKVLHRGLWDETLIRGIELDSEHQEGYVVRSAAAFHYKEFRRLVGKFVRRSHVQTDEHWMRQEVKFNEVRK